MIDVLFTDDKLNPQITRTIGHVSEFNKTCKCRDFKPVLNYEEVRGRDKIASRKK